MDNNLSVCSFYWESGDYVLYNPPGKGEDILDSAMIYDAKEHKVIIIENDQVAYEIKKNMRDAGVPVVTEPPPGQNILEKAMAELSCLRPGTLEYVNAYNEIRAMKITGRTVSEIERRIQELCRRQ